MSITLVAGQQKRLDVALEGGGDGVECLVDTDCPDGFVCIGGKCVSGGGDGVECLVDTDCPDGFVCIGGKCV